VLRLKTVFHLYNNEIDELIKRCIAEKYIEQIGKCVLTDIAGKPEQAGITHTKGDEEKHGGFKL
jgi:hypothetical protein